jgi:hypothetical protein
MSHFNHSYAIFSFLLLYKKEKVFPKVRRGAGGYGGCIPQHHEEQNREKMPKESTLGSWLIPINQPFSYFLSDSFAQFIERSEFE